MTFVREYEERDLIAIHAMHKSSGLPINCLPDLRNKNFIIKRVAESTEGPVIFGGLKLTGELFVLVDHTKGTPESRWSALQRLTADGLARAAKRGLQDVTAWVPPDIEEAFAKRLLALGFTRSRWNSYTAILG